MHLRFCMWWNHKKFQEIKNCGSTVSCGAWKRRGCFLYVYGKTCERLNFNRGMHIRLWTVKSNWSVENRTKQIKISSVWCYNFFESVILHGLSDYSHKISCWNSRLDTTKYRDTTLEKILKFSIERVSDTVLYKYRSVNCIIYLTINSVLRRSNDWYIMIRVSSCEIALTLTVHRCNRNRPNWPFIAMKNWACIRALEWLFQYSANIRVFLMALHSKIKNFDFLTISPIFLNISVSRNDQTGPLPTEYHK